MKRRAFLQTLGLSTLPGLSVGAGSAPASARKEMPPSEPGSGAWSIVLLPDTQFYSAMYPEVFQSQTDWIVRQRHRHNIQFVLHLGDVTHNNTHPQWANAYRAMETLQKAGIPFLLASGNHDIGTWGRAKDRQSHFSDYFLQKGRVSGESENAYLRVTVGEAKFLLLVLEFGPRDAVVDWANALVKRHPDHHAILVTHAYLYSDGTRYDWDTKGSAQRWNPRERYGINQSAEGVNDGEALWRKLVSRHPQFAFTFNGHVLNDGVGYLASAGAHGRRVHQMLVNYQRGVQPDRKNGGGGFLRLLEVQADGRTIVVRDYSPYYDQWLTEPERCFSLTMDRNLNEPFAVLRADAPEQGAGRERDH